MEARSAEDRRPRGLCSHCGDFLRWLLLLALVTAAVCSFGLYFIHSRLDQEIRLHVLNKFQMHYPDLIVRVRSAHRAEGRGIEIRGLSISAPARDGREIQMLYVEEMFAECAAELADFAAGTTQARRLVLRGVKLQVVRLPDKTWNVAQLFPPPQFGDTPPPVTIENSTITIVDLSGDSRRVMQLHDFATKVIPLAQTTAAIAQSTPPAIRIDGSFIGDHIREVRISGQITPATSEFDLTGEVRGLQINTESIREWPDDLVQHAAALRSATGTAGFTFGFAKAGANSSPTYSLIGKFTGRLEDPLLPQPLIHVDMPFEINNDRFVVRNASAQAGPTQLRFAGQVKLPVEKSPYSIRVKAEQLVLDERLANSLPPHLREQWDKFDPRGLIDGDMTLRFDGERTHMSIVADLLDTSFAYHKLPYRIQHARGQVRYKDDLLEVDQIFGSASGVPVLFDGKLLRPEQDPTGWFRIRLDQPLPIDGQLIRALPRSSRKVVEALNPRHGKITASYRFDRPNLRVPPRKRLQVNLEQCSMEYERFRYPLYDIRGSLQMDNDVWTFSNLEGRNGSAFIMCRGGWRRVDASNALLDLSFDAYDVPLEDELREALPQGAQSFWSSLRPRGTIDHLEIDVRYQSMARDLSVTVNGLKRRAADDLAERITIKPTWLPYQLDEVVGVVRYDNGVAEFEDVHGRHGNTSVQLSGRFDTLPDDRWQVQVKDLHIDRLRADNELVPALPGPLARAVRKLNLRGPISVSGDLHMQGEKAVQRPTSANWDLDFDVEGATLDFGQRLEHLRGSMHLAGSIGERGHYSHGSFAIDSMVYKGLQLTELKGPLSIDDDYLAFGETMRRPEGQRLRRPLKANMFGGTLVGSGQISLNEGSMFELDGALFDADLATISREFAPDKPDKPDISGHAFAQVHLTGAGAGTHKLRGNGNVQLRDANIYELPVMVRLLKIIRVKEPDETAFTTSDMAFTIEADRIYFKQIDFNGDAVNLRGRGEMTFDRTIDLVFETSVLARDGAVDRLLRPLFRDRGGLFEVVVKGTLDTPQVTRGVNQAIQQVFPETERRLPVSEATPDRGFGGRSRR